MKLEMERKVVKKEERERENKSAHYDSEHFPTSLGVKEHASK